MLGSMDAEAVGTGEVPLVADYLAEWLEVQRTQVQPSTRSSSPLWHTPALVGR
jgi:hypothetical protein